MKEERRDVVGYEGIYQISNKGVVYDKWGNELSTFSTTKSNDGYKRIRLQKNKIRKHFQIHRLVAMAFIPNPDNKPVVHHIDENKKNNNVENLMWVTQKENMNAGTVNQRLSERNTNNYKRSKRVIVISEDGSEKEYPSISEVSRKLGLSTGNIFMVLKGKRNHTGGYKFRYAV